jgi:hypothetical protein
MATGMGTFSASPTEIGGLIGIAEWLLFATVTGRPMMHKA